jgi:hypothetical protein
MNKTLLFLIGCLGTRLAISLIAKFAPPDLLPFLGVLALLPAIGFIIIYLSDLRKSGVEAGGKIWWNDLRPVHACIYLLFALFALKKQSFSWVVLLLDFILGYLVWLSHYYLK